MLNRGHQEGASLVEVLVSVLIVVLGLLGLAGLQSHAALAEAEAFQRAQAVTMLQDMTDRFNANRFRRGEYATPDPVGTGSSQPADCTVLTGGARDLCEWDKVLLGSAETLGTNKVGGMPEARGCVTRTVAMMPEEWEIAVVWQGATPSKAPVSTCGAGKYGSDERYRRALTTTIRVGCLQNNPATGECTFPEPLP